MWCLPTSGKAPHPTVGKSHICFHIPSPHESLPLFIKPESASVIAWEGWVQLGQERLILGPWVGQERTALTGHPKCDLNKTLGSGSTGKQWGAFVNRTWGWAGSFTRQNAYSIWMSCLCGYTHEPTCRLTAGRKFLQPYKQIQGQAQGEFILEKQGIKQL